MQPPRLPTCLPTVHIRRLALDVQTWYRQQLEREPVKFMETAGLAALVTAVVDVAGFVGADWRDVVPVTNATTGVNAVLQSLKLQKGDLILMTNVTYAAVSNPKRITEAAAGDVHVMQALRYLAPCWEGARCVQGLHACPALRCNIGTNAMSHGCCVSHAHLMQWSCLSVALRCAAQWRIPQLLQVLD
jgi:hypothetical protein